MPPAIRSGGGRDRGLQARAAGGIEQPVADADRGGDLFGVLERRGIAAQSEDAEAGAVVGDAGLGDQRVEQPPGCSG